MLNAILTAPKRAGIGVGGLWLGGAMLLAILFTVQGLRNGFNGYGRQMLVAACWPFFLCALHGADIG